MQAPRTNAGGPGAGGSGASSGVKGGGGLDVTGARAGLANHPRGGTGGGSTNDARARKKTTSLWSYILPASPADGTRINSNNTASEVLPTTGPLDRNAVSVRLMLGDAKAALEQLSDRVDRVLADTLEARREAKTVEQSQSAVVQEISQVVQRALVAVNEANAAHTSRLEEALARCSTLEAALAAQTQAILDLNAKCDMNVSQTTHVLNRLGATQDSVMNLLPVVPLLQNLPTEIQNSQLKTANAIDRVVENVLRTCQDHRHEFVRISEEHKVATQNWISEHLQRQTKAMDGWKESTGAALDALREEFTRGLEAQRESVTVALSLQRQEIGGMLSAVLPVLGPKADPLCNSGSAPARLGGTLIGADASTPRQAHSLNQTSPFDNRGATMNINGLDTHTPQDRPCGRSSSIIDSGFVTARSCDSEEIHMDEHAAKKSRLDLGEHTAAVLDKNSIDVQLGRVLVAETQSTALSSVPDEEATAARPEEESLALVSEDEASAVQHTTTAGQTFGTLNQRTFSAAGQFTTPDSPPFSVQRQPLTAKKAREIGITHHGPATQNIQHRTRPTVRPGERFPETTTSILSETIDPTRAPTLDRSSPGPAIDSAAIDRTRLTVNLNKRGIKTDDTPHTQGLAKRQRKAKTRTIMNSQELLMLDSSPER